MPNPRFKILILCLGFAFCKSQGQNLVRNMGFDSLYSCPFTTDELYKSVYWFKPSIGSSDLFSACSGIVSVPQTPAGYQNPRSDTCFAGFIAYGTAAGSYREYVSTELSDTLKPGRKYCIEFYLNLSNGSTVAIDNIGAYFSNDSIRINNPWNLPYTPQFESPDGVFITDTLNWVSVSGEFTATGSEKFITIGNFYDSVSTDTFVMQSGPIGAYYFIEDVSVYEKIEANAGTDLTICEGDTIITGSFAQQGVQYQWTPSTGLNNDTIAMPMAMPTTTTTYTINISYSGPNCTGKMSDTVTIFVQGDCIEPEIFVPSAFSPNGDGQNDVLFARSNVPLENFEFAIYDRIGELVFKTGDISVGWDGNFKGKKVNGSVFYYYLKGTYKGEDYLLKGDVTLIL